jgi:hypothetical protein
MTSNTQIRKIWCWYIKNYKTGWFWGANVDVHIPAPCFAYGMWINME